MDHFRLDDVREHFTADMRDVLSRIGAGLGAPGQPSRALGRAAVAALDDGCHTMIGSAPLVGAEHLAAGAQELRRLAQAIDGRLAAASEAAAHAEAMGATARALLDDLGRVLASELAGDAPAAAALAAGIGARVDDAIANPPASGGSAVESLPLADEYTFFHEPADQTFAPGEHRLSPDGIHAAPGTAGFQPAIPGSNDRPQPEGDLHATPIDLDAALREAFTGEALALLDDMDRAALGLESGGDARAALGELFRLHHTFKGAANTVGLTAIGRLAHRLEDVLEAAADGELPPLAALASIALSAQRRMRGWIAAGCVAPPDEVAAGCADIDQYVAKKADFSGNSITAPAPQPTPARRGQEAAPTVSLASERLDALMGLVGELVQGRSRLENRVGSLAALGRDLRSSRDRLMDAVDAFREHVEFARVDSVASHAARRTPHAAPVEQELDHYEDVHILARALAEIGGDIGELQRQISAAIGAFGEDAQVFTRTVGGIQGEITRARLVPVEGLFTRLHLAVRDAAERAGMTVRVVGEGGDVGLDKAIVDGLGGPLLHLVRNAVVHGIEDEERRRAAGKPANGTITLSARRESGQVVVTIGDDGRGLDLAGLHREGLRRGLIPPGTAIDSEAVRDLVFASGVSTLASATEVAGRGIGGDAARRGIQRLGGSIAVESTPGAGTTFTIILPVNLAIARALVVRCGGQAFALPLSFVERILDLGEAGVVTIGGIPRVAFAGQQLALLDLGTALGLPARRPGPGAGLVLRLGGRRSLLRVEELVGRAEVVVGGLGELLNGHPLFSGVSIGGDGELLPILDLAGVLAAPLTATPQAEVLPAIPAPVAAATRVLVADDSLSVRTVAARQLRALGVEVVLAVDGEDALGKLRAERFDLLLTDLEMPRLTGYDLLREVRFVALNRELPVVVITSRSGERHRELAAQLGAADYLAKPFTPEQIAAVVARWARR